VAPVGLDCSRDTYVYGIASEPSENSTDGGARCERTTGRDFSLHGDIALTT
jgi:hypothetical protein